jgi:hypothetical protein
MNTTAIVRSPTNSSLLLLRPSDPGWNECLERVDHDFFHTAEYHHLSQVNGGGEAWLAIFGDRDKFLAWPYILQDIKGFGKTHGLRDITSVYGYSGPLANNCRNDEDFLTTAWESVVEAWRTQGAISVFTRFHPILNNVEAISSIVARRGMDVGGGPYAQGRTVAIDLRQSEEEIWSGYKRNARSALRRCERAGFITESDPDWKYLEAFSQLYYRTMERNQAVAFYFFSKQYFCDLRKALGDRGSLMITRFNDEIIAGGLLMECNGIVNVHFLAGDDRFGNLSPSKMVINEAQLWARRRGNRLLHLGGGRASNNDDPLFRFKTLFSELCYPFYTGRWVLDREAYEFLTNERRKMDENILEAYFPAYRAPASKVSPSENLYADPTVNNGRITNKSV